MSKFDKAINSILNRLIFEQTINQPSEEDVKHAQNEIENTRKIIEEEFKKNPEEFIKNAENQINSYNYVTEDLSKYFSDLVEKFKKPPLNEDVETDGNWLGDITAKVGDYAYQATKTAGGYIDGAFENVLDFLTDQAVERMPKILSSVVGKQNYDAIRAEVDQLDDSFFYKVIAVLDISGVLSWTYLDKAKQLYEENLGKEDEDIYTLNLLAATIAVIPGVSALKIFVLPFKLLFSPLRALLGGARANAVARSVANELKRTLNLTGKIDRASSTAARGGRISQTSLNFAKNVTKPVKPIAKLAAGAAKAATITSGGDIPKMVDDWKKKGEEIASRIPEPKTLQRIPSFQRITTQP